MLESDAELDSASRNGEDSFEETRPGEDPEEEARLRAEREDIQTPLMSFPRADSHNERPGLLRGESHRGFFSDRIITARKDSEDFRCNAHGLGKRCPMCSSYAQEWDFLFDITASVVFGCTVGLLCAGFVWPMHELPLLWTEKAYPNEPASVQFMQGKPYWIAVIGATGALVGVLKLVLALDEDYDGLFKQINQQYVHPFSMLKLVTISVVSVSGGAALGPSAVLGSVGGAVAQVVAEARGFEDDRVRRSCLHGIGAALGCLFPSPVTPMVLISELGPGDELQAYYLRYFAEMGTAVLAAYAVNLAIAGRSYLPFVPIGSELGPYEFESVHLLWGVAIGAISGIVGLLIAIGMGVSSQVFREFKRILPHKVYTIAAPMVGGILIGVVSIVVPLGLGSGNAQLLAVISHVQAHKMSAGLLVSTVAAKIVCVSLSVGSGFVGGVVFPLYFVGACLGLAMHLIAGEVTGEPLLLFLSCFISAVPASLFPIPITHLVTVMAMLEIGESNCAPMFAACIVSNMVCSGSGALAALLRFAKTDDLFDAPAMPEVLETDDADFMDSFPEYTY